MLSFSKLVWFPVALLVIGACGSNGAGDDDGGGPDSSLPDSSVGNDGAPAKDGSPSDSGKVSDASPPVLPQQCNGSVLSTATTATGLPSVPSALTVPANFKMEVIASIGGARELAALPNGDLLVATSGSSIYIVPNAEADAAPGKVSKFATASDSYASGITYVPTTCAIYVATNQNVYKVDYQDAQLTGTLGNPIAKVRQGSVTPGSDGDVHHTTSVAFSNGHVYASVGSGCNACTEVDQTRASIQIMDANGANMTTYATHIRNAIAITTNPATGMIWAGGAGQDDLPAGHPYEFFDAVTSHGKVVDYGWPDCEENHNAFGSGANCSGQAVPLIEFPAYSTLIGASFYPPYQTGAHTFPSQYLGGVFVAAHGSWHQNGNSYAASPLVGFVAMNGDVPATAVNWSDPTKQWTTFIGGFQDPNSITRHGRPTGVAVGSKGSLFVADDQNGYVYRIRPN